MNLKLNKINTKVKTEKMLALLLIVPLLMFRPTLFWQSTTIIGISLLICTLFLYCIYEIKKHGQLSFKRDTQTTYVVL